MKEASQVHVFAERDLKGAAYAASDLFVSASNFETLGNTVIEAGLRVLCVVLAHLRVQLLGLEALCSGTPCALQPAQGHLEQRPKLRLSWLCLLQLRGGFCHSCSAGSCETEKTHGW